MPSEYLQEVANDYEKLLEDNKDCNVIIYVGENENVKELHAHSCILRIKSQYFRAELSKEWDDLLLDEIVIWDNLIKWCFAQHSNISQDPTQWNNEEITIMERTISKFIPLVRFNYISPESFATKVYPFKEIMPKSLVNNMISFHMAQNKQLNEDKRPPRQSKCKIDSVIINQKHIEIFAIWIYRKVYISEYIPYNFQLLYRASRDGNTDEAFHEKCDNKGATLVIVKITNSNQIVGGDDLQSANLGYSNGVNSICCYGINGPVFGEGSDLAFYGGTWFSHINNNNCYPKIDIQTGGFKADDYEIFQVIKK
ncbi:unnamed protein product [Rhizophagus irregularis]|nr:unnamed protein product [Rhizophagus irregularis]